jgi:hypothetical protein
MPTRRVFELVVVTSVLLTPALGTVKMWAKKTLATSNEGTVSHGLGQILVVLL